MNCRISPTPIALLPLLVVSILSLSTAPGEAGSLRVTADAAHSGIGCDGTGCGVEVGLDGCATTSDRTVTDRTILEPASFEACSSLQVADVTVATGARLALSAGERIGFGSGFSVAGGASLAAGVDAALNGDAAVADDSPHRETRYAARFFVNLDGATIGTDDRFVHFAGRDAAGRELFRLLLKRDPATGEIRLFAEVRRDDGSYLSTEDGYELAVPPGWHAVELEWRAGGPSGSEGLLVLCLDDDGSRVRCERLPNASTPPLDNGRGRLDRVWWGALGVDGGMGGTLAMDDFESYRQGPIGGPVPASLQHRDAPHATRVTQASHPQNCTLEPDTCHCVLDAACVPSSFFRLYQKGVALVYIPGKGTCTAFLLNDGSPSDGSDLLLTANHCIATHAEAEASLLLWDYVTPSCQAPPPDPVTLPSSEDLVMLTTSAAYDITILEIHDLPGGRFFFGIPADFAHDDLFSLHHGRQAPQQFSWMKRRGLNQCDGEEAACLRTHHRCDGFSWFSATVWDGTMDEGGSGAPVFDENGRIAGVVEGHCFHCELITGGTAGKVREALESIGRGASASQPPFFHQGIIYRDSFEDGQLFGWSDVR